jgi:hypothetical protein
VVGAGGICDDGMIYLRGPCDVHSRRSEWVLQEAAHSSAGVARSTAAAAAVAAAVVTIEEAAVMAVDLEEARAVVALEAEADARKEEGRASKQQMKRTGWAAVVAAAMRAQPVGMVERPPEYECAGGRWGELMPVESPCPHW